MTLPTLMVTLAVQLMNRVAMQSFLFESLNCRNQHVDVCACACPMFVVGLEVSTLRQVSKSVCFKLLGSIHVIANLLRPRHGSELPDDREHGNSTAKLLRLHWF